MEGLVLTRAGCKPNLLVARGVTPGYERGGLSAHHVIDCSYFTNRRHSKKVGLIE